MIVSSMFLIKWQWIHAIKAVESRSKNEGLSRAGDDVFILLASMLDLPINDYVILNLVLEVC